MIEKSVPVRVLGSCAAWGLAFALLTLGCVLGYEHLCHYGLAVSAAAAVMCIRSSMAAHMRELRSMTAFREDVDQRLTRIR